MFDYVIIFFTIFFLGKSKQRNKKDAVKPQPSEVPSNEKTTTIEPENNATSISEVANPQPSNTESQTSTNTVSIESKPPTAQNTTTSSDHSLNSSTVQKQEIPSNHVESNHIISSEMEKTRETSEVAETTVAPLAEEMSKLLIEDAEAKAQAIENGNGSASSSANASKSSSQIKQKLKYDGLYMDGKFIWPKYENHLPIVLFCKKKINFSKKNSCKKLFLF